MSTDSQSLGERLYNIGDVSPHGEVVAIGIRDGERWYMALDDEMTSLMPNDK